MEINRLIAAIGGEPDPERVITLYDRDGYDVGNIKYDINEPYAFVLVANGYFLPSSTPLHYDGDALPFTGVWQCNNCLIRLEPNLITFIQGTITPYSQNIFVPEREVTLEIIDTLDKKVGEFIFLQSVVNRFSITINNDYNSDNLPLYLERRSPIPNGVWKSNETIGIKLTDTKIELTKSEFVVGQRSLFISAPAYQDTVFDTNDNQVGTLIYNTFDDRTITIECDFKNTTEYYKTNSDIPLYNPYKDGVVSTTEFVGNRIYFTAGTIPNTYSELTLTKADTSIVLSPVYESSANPSLGVKLAANFIIGNLIAHTSNISKITFHVIEKFYRKLSQLQKPTNVRHFMKFIPFDKNYSYSYYTETYKIDEYSASVRLTDEWWKNLQRECLLNTIDNAPLEFTKEFTSGEALLTNSQSIDLNAPYRVICGVITDASTTMPAETTMLEHQIIISQQ